jgi:thiamine pyrophosphate-dependent acetolactate synthase large subunit-like protein
MKFTQILFALGAFVAVAESRKYHKFAITGDEIAKISATATTAVQTDAKKIVADLAKVKAETDPSVQAKLGAQLKKDIEKAQKDQKDKTSETGSKINEVFSTLKTYVSSFVTDKKQEAKSRRRRKY